MVKTYSDLHPDPQKGQTRPESPRSDNVSLGTIALFALFPYSATIFQGFVSRIFNGCLSIGNSCFEQKIWDAINYPGILAADVIYQIFGCFNVPGDYTSVPCIEELSGFGYVLGVLLVSTVVLGCIGYLVGTIRANVK